ncbi:MAG: bis(5'-nucleosyl)-tetraphosphatase [Candidatus Heimdallarchaeaceae archaeon]
MHLEQSAGIVIYNRGRYLLLNYGRSWNSPDRWGLTKGHIERGESVKQAALREAYEETGIKNIEICDGFEKMVTYYFYRGEKKIKKTVVYLIGLTDTQKVHISAEHTGYYWASFDRALEMLTFENTRRVIRAAEDFLRDNDLAVDLYED